MLLASLFEPRALVFAAFAGEEEGLQGSRHFVANPPATLPLAGMRAGAAREQQRVGRMQRAAAALRRIEWPAARPGLGVLREPERVHGPGQPEDR